MIEIAIIIVMFNMPVSWNMAGDICMSNDKMFVVKIVILKVLYILVSYFLKGDSGGPFGLSA